MPRSSAAPRITGGATPADEADPAEVVMTRGPDPHGEARSLQSVLNSIRKARLEVDEVADRMEARAVNRLAGAQALVEDAGEHLNESAPEPRPAGGKIGRASCRERV